MNGRILGILWVVGSATAVGCAGEANPGDSQARDTLAAGDRYSTGDGLVGDSAITGDTGSPGDTASPGDTGSAGDTTSQGDPGSGGDTASSLCPPSAPYGSAVGSTIHDVTLNDCDGNSYSLHDLCDREAAWVFVYAGW